MSSLCFLSFILLCTWIALTMESVNLLLDLPFSLQLELYSEWLGGLTRSEQANVKSLLQLDSALCHKHSRPALFAIYQTINFKNFFFVVSRNRVVTQKMKWALSRQINLPKLGINCIEIDSNVLKLFFLSYGAGLKHVRLMDFQGAMTQLTKIIASECKGLETLELERCNITLPIVDILNKINTIREVRLQKKPLQGKAALAKVNKHLFEKISCPSVEKLALLDQVEVADVPAVTKAFPNVTHLELKSPSPDVLTAFFAVWSNIEVLHLVGMTEQSPLSAAILAAIGENCSHLRKIVLSTTQQIKPFPTESFVQMLAKCTSLSCVALESYSVTNYGEVLTAVAMTMNSRLQELQVGRMAVSAEAIVALAEHCPHLRVLNMHNLVLYPKYALLLQKCPLVKLRVSMWVIGTFQVQFLEHVAEHCRDLQVFSLLGGYENVKEHHIARILGSYKALKAVEVPSCDTRAWRVKVRTGVTLTGRYERNLDSRMLKDYDF